MNTKLLNFKSTFLVISSSLFITAFANLTMFFKAHEWLASTNSAQIHFLTLVVYQFLILTLLLSVLTAHRWSRLVICAFFLLASFSAYFADTYGVIIDRDMLVNASQSNYSEASGLISWKFALYVLVLFLIPSAIVYKIPFHKATFTKNFVTHSLVATLSLASIGVLFFSTSAFSSSFFREQKEIRVYSNPLNAIYASYQVVNKGYLSPAKEFVKIGEDASISRPTANRELIILVVGETARADHFSLNGYNKNTNPLLSQQAVVSFSNASSCGTSTAVSVPCMFSLDGKEKFDLSNFKNKGNFLDVVARAGVNVLWRDNNSSSKGAADRLSYEDFSIPKNNSICDPECRDIGMLKGLEEYINKQKTGDILIVLHQMGSHGPSYHERVPEDFQKFQPTCKTNQLDKCSTEQINNSYDNTILYTDYFLSEVIGLLKKYDDGFETSMLYVSDHGESLGEYGMYLHGMPYSMAPKGVTNIPIIMWFGKQMISSQKLNMSTFNKHRDKSISHDHISHTILGMFEIQTNVYKKELDLHLFGIN